MQPYEFWQEIHPPGSAPTRGPFREVYPATLEDGRQIHLPIRPLSDGRHALASLIINQAGFSVVEALAEDLARRLSAYRPDVVAGLPTLGLTLAAAVARHLGHSRYVPLGTSRKFWYDESLSVPMSSITTPEQIKRLYVDPRMLPLLQSRRVALVDDVMSSGTSIIAGLRVMESIGVEPVVIGAAMLQSDRWQAAMAAERIDWQSRTCGVFRTPMLTKLDDGTWSL